MKANFKKSGLLGLLYFALYIILPILGITIISVLNLLAFSNFFILMIIIFGIIGTIISAIKHLFPKENDNYYLFSSFEALFSGIYLFYIFGGFNLIDGFGTYSVRGTNFYASFGLQLIATTLLIASLITLISRIIKYIEVRKEKSYELRIRNGISLSSVIFGLSILIYLILSGFIITLIISGLNIDISVKENYNFDWDDNGTPPPLLNDDTIEIIAYFDVKNLGFYSIREVTIDADIYVEEDVSILLTKNTKIGEVDNIYYQSFNSMQFSKDNSLTIDIIPVYVPDLVTNDAPLEILITLQTFYAGIFIDLNVSTIIMWNSLI